MQSIINISQKCVIWLLLLLCYGCDCFSISLPYHDLQLDVPWLPKTLFLMNLNEMCFVICVTIRPTNYITLYVLHIVCGVLIIEEIRNAYWHMSVPVICWESLNETTGSFSSNQRKEWNPSPQSYTSKGNFERPLLTKAGASKGNFERPLLTKLQQPYSPYIEPVNFSTYSCKNP